MTISRNTKWALGAMLLVALVAVGAGLALGGRYATTQTARRRFTVDESFTDVRKILVRNDSAKQIVAMGGGSEFISQEWSAGGGELDSLELLDPEWRLELFGTLRVRTTDPYIGEHEISLDQQVTIEPDFLHSSVELDEPAERLRQYAMKTHFDRDPQSGDTRVTLELTQRIRTHAPWFAHGIADRRVLESAERTLANQETAIRRLVAEHIDDVPLLPLR